MPFGKYGAKSVQAMSNLFNSTPMNSAYRRAGSIGRKNSGWDDIGDMTRSGKRRVAGGAVIGGGILASDRSSGSRGLQTKSSAPPPMPPRMM